MLTEFIPDWRWSHYPFHAMLESIGSISALTISTLMIIMIKNDHLSPRLYVVACALIGMGLLDGFHAVLHVGVSFVWLHSIATMLGGVMFSMIWLPEAWLTEKRKGILLYTVIISSLIIGTISTLQPNILPAMIIDGHFSLIAQIINFTGGIGFLFGVAFFVHANNFTEADSQSIEFVLSENMVFANHCLLFGIAGLLFETSVLWDAGWWWWHILRFLAYLVVLIYFFTLFKRAQDLLRHNEIKLKDLNKDLEHRVQERTKELVKANEAKSDFLSHMSHELRTPMNAVLGFAQLLDIDNEIKGIQKQSVKEILLAGNHLLFLISEILDLSRIESGKLELSIETVNLNDVIKDCITMTMPQANERQIELRNQINSQEVKLLADLNRLKQVLINLLSNAVKYNRDHGSISINTESISDEQLRINITDTGEGINKNDIAKLFTSFERFNTVNNVDGTGIGLVISKYLVEAMGGKIGVESTPRIGSTFWIDIPLVN